MTLHEDTCKMQVVLDNLNDSVHIFRLPFASSNGGMSLQRWCVWKLILVPARKELGEITKFCNMTNYISPGSLILG